MKNFIKYFFYTVFTIIGIWLFVWFLLSSAKTDSDTINYYTDLSFWKQMLVIVPYLISAAVGFLLFSYSYEEHKNGFLRMPLFYLMINVSLWIFLAGFSFWDDHYNVNKYNYIIAYPLTQIFSINIFISAAWLIYKLWIFISAVFNTIQYNFHKRKTRKTTESQPDYSTFGKYAKSMIELYGPDIDMGKLKAEYNSKVRHN